MAKCARDFGRRGWRKGGFERAEGGHNSISIKAKMVMKNGKPGGGGGGSDGPLPLLEKRWELNYPSQNRFGKWFGS